MKCKRSNLRKREFNSPSISIEIKFNSFRIWIRLGPPAYLSGAFYQFQSTSLTETDTRSSREFKCMDTFRDVPEFFELELGESLIARTEILGQFEAVKLANIESDPYFAISSNIS